MIEKRLRTTALDLLSLGGASVFMYDVEDVWL